jgi:hypothetical protein
MSISRRLPSEAATAALLATIVCVVAAPEDLLLGNPGLHPAWVGVVVLAARYGTSGLLVGLATSGVALTAAALLVHGTITSVAERAASPSDVLALATATLVAWIAALHGTRVATVEGRLAASEADLAEADRNVVALEQALAELRRRFDRIDLSVSLWRDLAARLEGDDPSEAAGAALELALLRTGARSGLLVGRDPTGAELRRSVGLLPPTLAAGDRTVAAAVAARAPVSAREVAEVTADDADLAIPVLDASQRAVVAVIALAGIAPDRLRPADLRDLSVIAEWLAPALGASAPWPHLRSAEAGR